MVDASSPVDYVGSMATSTRTTPAPNGCIHCGEDKRTHPLSWSAEVGLHLWTQPTDQVRMERMKARRKAS